MTKPADQPFLAEQRLGPVTGGFPFESRFTEVAGARHDVWKDAPDVVAAAIVGRWV